MKPIRFFLAAFCSVFALSAAAAPPLKVTLVGDSTVAAYPVESAIHGWGEYLAAGLSPRVQLKNRAQAGASSASFMRDHLWQAALLDQPDVVLIQFGHNDLFHDLGTEQFAGNLQFFVTSARQQGAFPILVTPVERRRFHDGKFTGTLTAFAEATRRVAADTKTPVLDLNSLSAELFTRLGPERADQLADKPGDPNHFNALGAQGLAQIVLRELSLRPTPLRSEVTVPAKPAQPKPGKKRP